tara:strand:+ start:82 stop:678 length:597 start_codon:yes stop_codon:yes gene_type:complete
MKTLVFGYSSGIGKAIYDTCKEKGFEITGIGLDESVNIDNHEDRKQVVLASKDYDVIYVVPNGVTTNFSQCVMLAELFGAYQYEYKKIVIIGGSSPSTRNKDVKNLNKHLYDANNKALEFLSDKFNFLNDPCQVILIRPGRLDSGHNIGSSKAMIDPYKLADNIIKLVQMSKEMRITSTTIIQDSHTGTNGKLSGENK